MFAIYNTKLKKFVSGTNHRCYPRKQIMNDSAVTYPTKELAESYFKFRGCGKNYKVVEIEVKIVSKRKDIL